MTTLAYLDCSSGISGDMTLGALVDAGAPLAEIQQGITSLGLEGCRLVASEVNKCGFRATQITIQITGQHSPEHVHRHLHNITEMIDRSRLAERPKDLARKIFTLLAEAEAKVHGTTIEQVHFHEVGAVDSIADIVGVAIGLDLLGVERIIASPVPTGSGFIEIAHGRCSIPAPATGELLKGIPLAASQVEGELTTPTGAAIVASVVDSFGPLPAMKIEKIGYGAGQRDYKSHPNLLRLLLGQVDASEVETATSEQIWVVETNLDDLSGEMIGYCTNRLWDAGALDVFTTAISMKKNRPGVILTVLCRTCDVDQVEEILFSETTTFGIRRYPVRRHKLERQDHTVQTPWGPVEGKLVRISGSLSFSPEFESCRRLATEHHMALRKVFEAAQKAFDPGETDPRMTRKKTSDPFLG